MNAVMEAIVSRRSVRAFEKKELPAEALEEILKAATYAPSGKNQQTWQFTVVKSCEKIKQLAGLVETELNRPGYNMYEPEVIIIPSNDRESPFGMEDNAVDLQLGLTFLIGRLDSCLDLLDRLHIGLGDDEGNTELRSAALDCLGVPAVEVAEGGVRTGDNFGGIHILCHNFCSPLLFKIFLCGIFHCRTLVRLGY